jgi:hypothetical protein
MMLLIGEVVDLVLTIELEVVEIILLTGEVGDSADY